MEIVGMVVLFVMGLSVFVDCGLTLLGCGGRAEQGCRTTFETLGLFTGFGLMSVFLW